jgi:RNA polymerase sigma factor (sigma-70 family)
MVQGMGRMLRGSTTTPLNDRDLVARVQKGDREAFSTLVGRYQDRIYRFILGMSGSHEEALDLTQETFLKAYQGMASWQADALFKTWLYRIASNTTMDVLRRRKIVSYVGIEEWESVASQDAGPERQAQDRQSIDALEQALARIPLLYREALLMRELEGMSYNEIALALDITTGTVKSRIARARAGLLEMMMKNGHGRDQ